jgi:hypothetical protein
MKKNAADKVQQTGKKPFFARLLEAQELEQAAGGTLPFNPRIDLSSQRLRWMVSFQKAESRKAWSNLQMRS